MNGAVPDILKLTMMYLRTTLLTGMLLAVSALRTSAQDWHQKVDYQIDVRLDDKTHSIQARERVQYENRSPDTLRSIYFRLAWHGRTPQVSAKYTVFSVQQNGIAIDFKVLEPTPNPSVPPQSLSQSLLEIQLSRPLLPGEADVYTIAWQADVPIFSGGCGRNSPSGVDYTFSRWYPQACVYDRLGWHLGSPFEPDFSSEFGSYKVDITLAPKFMVAATGTLSNADAIGYGYENEGVVVKPNYGLVTVWKFQADQVQDFSWVADPELQHDKEPYREGLWLHDFHFKNESQLASLKNVLNTFERVAYRYPYPQLSVVQMGELRAEIPMLVFSSNTVPEMMPAISWDFQEIPLKTTYLLRQVRYVIGDEAFKKGLNAIMRRYLYARPPVEECLYLFERSAGVELDWLWEQYSGLPAQVDYGIQSVKADDTNGTTVVLERLKGTLLPVVVEVMYADATVVQHYIPVEFLRGGVPPDYKTAVEPPWPSTAKTYTLKLSKPPGMIQYVMIDPQGLSGDVNPDNNRNR